MQKTRLKQREERYLPIVAKAFIAEGLPAELGAAIARQESAWDPSAQVVTGGDGVRGGAYGLCQMTLKTALALDREATVGRLLSPEYNAKLAAKLCKENWLRAKGRIQDVIALYNSGKEFHRAPLSTKTVYVPNVEQYMQEYRPMCMNLEQEKTSTPA
jgi:soluble lytic murein transglycosylase-like protein